MLAILFALAVVAAIIYYYFVPPRDYWKERGVPYKNPTWMFGENYRNMIGLEPFVVTLDDLYKKSSNNRYYGYFQFTKPTLLINDPELIKKVMVKDFDHFMDHRTFVSEEVDPLWGKNLFELKGDQWKHMRSTVSPSFTSSKMKFLYELITDCAQNCVKSLIGTKENVMEYDVGDIMSRYSSDIIASTAFGVAVDSLRHPDNEFYQMAREASDFSRIWMKFTLFAQLILPVPVIKMLGLKIFNNKVSNYFRGVVDETVKIRKARGIVRPDMIHILLEAQKNSKNDESVQNEGITNADILAQSMISIVGGLETLTRLLTFMSYELAINKPVQDKLRDEIMKTRNETNGRIAYDSILNMKYLDMVVSESLRKYPVMSGVDRICTKPYVIEPAVQDEKPLFIAKGVSLWIPIFSLHRDPKHFENPEVFDPERFSDDNKNKINPYVYMPFGVGPRNCIGARFSLLVAKALVYHLLSDFELFPIEKTHIPIEFRKDVTFIIPDKSVFLGLRRIHS